MRTPRVLVVAASLWPLAGRISIALSKAGFCVASVSRTGSVIRSINAIEVHYTYKPWARRRSIINAINAFNPDLLVCTDDEAASELHRIHQDASGASGDENASRLAKLIEISLGNPDGFEIALEKSQFIKFAEELGVRCPKTTIVPDTISLEQELKKITYPIVLKADGTCGGAGVRIANSPEDARKAFRNLSKPGWLGVLVKSFDGLTFQPLLNRLSGRRSVVTLQQYVSGRPANRSVLCAEGEILAGLSAEVHETQDSTGPSTVAGIIDQTEMRATTELLARHLKLAGFHGFDFVIDSTNQAWLLELNCRVTSMSHFSVGNFSPANTLFSYVTGAVLVRSDPPVMDKLIALFPQEWQRCPDSPYLKSCYHDVPWDEPEFVRACLSPDVETSSTGRIRRRIFALLGLGKPIIVRDSQSYRPLFDLAKRATTQPHACVQAETSPVNQDVAGETPIRTLSAAKSRPVA